MKIIHKTNGSTKYEYTKEEWQKFKKYRKRCEELLKYFHHPNDMERVYTTLVALAEIGAEESVVTWENKSKDEC